MAQIINGEFLRNETNKDSMGGTEQMTLELSERIDKELLQDFQIISSRVRGELDESKIRLFWAHDLPGDPESDFLKDKNNHDKFHKFVFVSNWQMQRYIDAYGIPWSKSVVLQNAIDPLRESNMQDLEKINLIYFSTPHRGLNILVPVFEKLCEKYDNLHLNVYSSFDLYGWKQRDEQYKELFDRINAHDKMTNHGSVEKVKIREAVSNSHIFAYPSIWAETSCLCLMEAMSAGLACVHSNYAALPETAANWTNMYQMNEHLEQHAGVFYHVLESTIIQLLNENTRPMVASKLKSQKSYADVFYNWNARSHEWTALLTSLKNSVKDRSIPKEQFKYSA